MRHINNTEAKFTSSTKSSRDSSNSPDQSDSDWGGKDIKIIYINNIDHIGSNNIRINKVNDTIKKN